MNRKDRTELAGVASKQKKQLARITLAPLELSFVYTYQNNIRRVTLKLFAL